VTLLFLESVGTSELLLILVVALIVFGPRKLPELSRSLGKGLSEFRRASDEFKRTWEREVNLDSYERERQVADAMLPPEREGAAATANTIAPAATAPVAAANNAIARGAGGGASAASDSPSGGPAADQAAAHDAAGAAPQSPHKADWL
jgi:TatA/E family protein of Tat protein translocase